jgi:hypothetical protein
MVLRSFKATLEVWFVTEHLPAGESFPVWQLAQMFHVDRKHLINLIESGEIKVAFDLRGKASSQSCIRVPRNSLLEFLEKRQVIVPAPKRHSRKN